MKFKVTVYAPEIVMNKTVVEINAVSAEEAKASAISMVRTLNAQGDFEWEDAGEGIGIDVNAPSVHAMAELAE